jgi:hypothetical protein
MSFLSCRLPQGSRGYLIILELQAAARFQRLLHHFRAAGCGRVLEDNFIILELQAEKATP